MNHTENYLKVKNHIPRLIEWGIFKRREKQFEYCKLMKELILDIISSSFNRDTISCLIQITKHGSKDENLKKWFDKLGYKYSEKFLDRCLRIPREYRGLTGAARATIEIGEGFTAENAEDVRTFLIDVSKSNSKEEVIRSVNEFSTKKVPYVTDGIYSPWLTYLKPDICPIANNHTKEFFANLGWEGDSYSSLIEFTESLASFFPTNRYLYLDDLAKRDDISTYLFSTIPSKNKAKAYVGYYLSKWGPDKFGRFKTTQWSEVYSLFYNSLEENQSIDSFSNSLKNFRDGFDSHIADSPRRGWRSRDDNESPAKLSKDPKDAFDSFEDIPEEYIWNVIKNYIHLDNRSVSFDVKQEGGSKMSKAQNIILYGPPGTGKTYKSRFRALEIIGADQKNVVEVFNRLQREQQVDFITFHQSFSYEQFVEGITPVTNEDGSLSYDIAPGVFKRICQNALCELILPKEEVEDGITTPSFDEAYINLLEQIEYSPRTLKTSQGSEFIIKPSARDGVRVDVKNGGGWSISKDALKNVYVELTSMKSPPYTRKDIRTVTNHSLASYIMPIVNEIANMTDEEELSELRKFKPDEVLKYLEKGNYKLNPTPKQFVLIIDEINRGNISQILGDLITLIEPTKRIGGDEDILLTLPYSKDTFGVPSNLHIIGTMNTADRSVEAMDTALRRRFDFEELMPSGELVDDLVWHNFESFSVKDIFKCINERIEYFLGRDHTLGHFFFIYLEKNNEFNDLKKRFSNKVIPLLKEYFYEDWEKIGLILGDEFIDCDEVEPKFAPFVAEGEYSVKRKYHLKSEKYWNEKTFLGILSK